MATHQTVDITPSTRVLRMLGQIDFKQWQCLAELIDNAVDAFLVGNRTGHGAMFPQVNVEVSSSLEIKRGKGKISVSDNGPGMTPDQLERAVRAGYSGNDSVDKLGLFGMGFNVATARLGNCTEVWTTRLEDDNWHGIKIDFDVLERAKAFSCPLLARPKLPSEASRCGTEIIITKLDIDRASYLRSSRGLKVTRDKLSHIYNKLMNDFGLHVIVVGQPLRARPFCVWNENRSVSHQRLGRIPARMPIDRPFGERQYCEDCWVWLLESDDVCPACGKTDSLMLRSRHIAGWIGIQRFFDHDDYGIDLIRNGRVIEERSKIFFSWESEDGEILEEYPVDTRQLGGRIIGEIEMDFVPLQSHHKDSFDHNSAEWQLAVEAIRGKGPILPSVRQQRFAHLYGDENSSPLARLHAGYRRADAGLRCLVPGDEKKKIINTEPQRWATEFWKGTAEFQSDDKWYEAVLVAERARTGADVRDLEGLDLFKPEEEEGTEGNGNQPEPPKVSTATYERDTALSLSVELPEIPGSPILNVITDRLVSGSLESGLHLEVAPLASNVTIAYDPNHEMFTRTLTQPLDCWLEELSYQFLQRSGANLAEWPLSRVVYELRQRYFVSSVDSFEEVHRFAIDVLDALLEHYVDELSQMAPLSGDELDESDRTKVLEAVVLKERAGQDRAEEVIKGGLYPRYLGHVILPRLLTARPRIALDGRFFSTLYSDVPANLKLEVVEQITIPIKDMLWIADPRNSDGAGSEWRIQLARAAANLRLLLLWRA